MRPQVRACTASSSRACYRSALGAPALRQALGSPNNQDTRRGFLWVLTRVACCDHEMFAGNTLGTPLPRSTINSQPAATVRPSLLHNPSRLRVPKRERPSPPQSDGTHLATPRNTRLPNHFQNATCLVTGLVLAFSGPDGKFLCRTPNIDSTSAAPYLPTHARTHTCPTSHHLRRQRDQYRHRPPNP